MSPKTHCLLWLAATLNVTAALADGAAAPAPASAPGGIRISIKNVYEVELNFGPLGKGSREGTDTAEGVLEFRAGKYIGIVTAWVSSTQTLAGMIGSCGPGSYRNSQQLQVVGHDVSGFNPAVQTVTFNQATATGSPSSDYLMLEFAPAPGTALQPPNPNPDQDQVIDCHTIIETEAGRFLPLNDSRWTMEGGGYIIALPSSGTIDYTDETAKGAQIGPFNAKKSVWTIEVERLR